MVSTNPKDAIGDTKPRLDLVPPALMIHVAKVQELGARKYGPFNWRSNKVRHTVYLAAAMRHIVQALDGEDLDPESGQPHVAHAAACMGIVLDANSIGALIDDRPTKGAASELIKKFTLKESGQSRRAQAAERDTVTGCKDPYPPLPEGIFGC